MVWALFEREKGGYEVHFDGLRCTGLQGSKRAKDASEDQLKNAGQSLGGCLVPGALSTYPQLGFAGLRLLNLEKVGR